MQFRYTCILKFLLIAGCAAPSLHAFNPADVGIYVQTQLPDLTRIHIGSIGFIPSHFHEGMILPVSVTVFNRSNHTIQIDSDLFLDVAVLTSDEIKQRLMAQTVSAMRVFNGTLIFSLCLAGYTFLNPSSSDELKFIVSAAMGVSGGFFSAFVSFFTGRAWSNTYAASLFTPIVLQPGTFVRRFVYLDRQKIDSDKFQTILVSAKILDVATEVSYQVPVEPLIKE